jgi:hypothetical protein
MFVKHGRVLFEATPKFVRFTQIDAADRLLNDLARYPHAFVLASIMDQQVKAERAWLIPFRNWCRPKNLECHKCYMSDLCQLPRERNGEPNGAANGS